jgi:hypothetical protein
MCMVELTTGTFGPNSMCAAIAPSVSSVANDAFQ